MSIEPRAFFAIDLGTATISAALIGRVATRWRLIGSVALPAGIDVEPLLSLLVERVQRADPELAGVIGLPMGSGPATGPAGEPIDLAVTPTGLGRAAEWPRLVSTSSPPRLAVVLAPTDRRRALLEAAIGDTGWQIDGASLDRADGLALTARALDPAAAVIVAGAGAPPSPEERRRSRELGALLTAVAQRRPEVAVVLAGSMADLAPAMEEARADLDTAGPVVSVPQGAGVGPSEGLLRARLDALRAPSDDGRRGILRSAGSISAVLGRRTEVIDIGVTAGARCVADPPAAGDPESLLTWAISPRAGLVPEEPDDEVVDSVRRWLALPVDRPRLRDRLRDLWLAPWAEATGDGAQLRMAVARAAMERLADATEALPSGAPDVLVLAGGAWAAAPAAPAALAACEGFRRQGVMHVTFDHARLLGPLGTIEDEGERRALFTDLADDMLVPLATVVVPQGIRQGRDAGRAVLEHGQSRIERPLVAGRIEVLPLPAGASGALDLECRDGVVLGARGRTFAIEVAGGLAGVIVDLRDVPLRLPDRADRRRDVLAGWQRAVWPALGA